MAPICCSEEPQMVGSVKSKLLCCGRVSDTAGSNQRMRVCRKLHTECEPWELRKPAAALASTFNQELVLRLAQRDHRKPSLAQQRRLAEQWVGLDFSERGGIELVTGSNCYPRIPGVAVIHRDYCGRAHRAFFVAGVIDDQLVPRLHGVEVFQTTGLLTPSQTVDLSRS